MGTGSPEKESQEEYQVLNEKGEKIKTMQVPEGVGEEFYMNVLADGEEILSYKKLIKTEDGWGEEVEPGKIK